MIIVPAGLTTNNTSGLAFGLRSLDTLIQGIGSVVREGVRQDALTQSTRMASEARQQIARMTSMADQLALTDPTGAAEARRAIEQLESQLNAAMAGLGQTPPQAPSTTRTLLVIGGVALAGGFLLYAWRQSRR